jgi:sulfur carrier protein ThiS
MDNMARIRVFLHSYLREILPPEAKGQITLELPEESRIRDVIRILSIPDGSVCAVHDQIDPDRERLLHDGDELHFLRPSSGG